MTTMRKMAGACLMSALLAGAAGPARAEQDFVDVYIHGLTDCKRDCASSNVAGSALKMNNSQ